MLLLSQGCCFIQSLLFSYGLQEDSVKFSRKFISVPCQPSGRHGIQSGRSSVSNIRPDDEIFPSGRPSVHCSIRPDDVPYRLDSRQTKHHPSGWRAFSVRPLLYREATVPALHPSGCLSSPSGRLSVIDQLQILSKLRIREDWYTRPDDVVSRPDALLYKARIAIQISPSEHQSALVRTRVQLIWKLPIRLQPSGRMPIMVRTRA
jgi:hypothetical protein